MPSSRRWQGQAPRASLLHPVWEPERDPSPEAFIARSLLGAGVVGASRKLSMLDLRVWAALLGQLGEQLRASPAGDLEHPRERTVQTTGYQLLDAVWGQRGGSQWLRLRGAITRLADTRICVRVIERDPDLAVQQIRDGYLPLLGEVWLASTRLDLCSPSEWGALKATTSLRAEIGRWSAEQVGAADCTWLDLDLLRTLGTGLAARVWVALEAWARWPQRSFDGREETAIGLGRPALESLGVGGYSRERDARLALARAATTIERVDSAYERLSVERRGGWCLVARRVSGARARGKAREGGAWRSPGIAAGKRNRSERSAVQAAIAGSLAEASAADRPA